MKLLTVPEIIQQYNVGREDYGILREKYNSGEIKRYVQRRSKERMYSGISYDEEVIKTIFAKKQRIVEYSPKNEFKQLTHYPKHKFENRIMLKPECKASYGIV